MQLSHLLLFLFCFAMAAGASCPTHSNMMAENRSNLKNKDSNDYVLLGDDDNFGENSSVNEDVGAERLEVVEETKTAVLDNLTSGIPSIDSSSDTSLAEQKYYSFYELIEELAKIVDGEFEISSKLAKNMQEWNESYAAIRELVSDKTCQ